MRGRGAVGAGVRGGLRALVAGAALVGASVAGVPSAAELEAAGFRRVGPGWREPEGVSPEVRATLEAAGWRSLRSRSGAGLWLPTRGGRRGAGAATQVAARTGSDRPVAVVRARTEARKAATDQRARRRAGIQRVDQLMRLYEAGDVAGMLRLVTPDAVPDPVVLDNAVRRELRQISNIRVETFPGQVVVGPGTVTVEVRWNRGADDTLTGARDAITGTARFVLVGSGEDLKVQRMRGPLPFGARQADLVGQAGGERAREHPSRKRVTLDDGVGP